MLPLHVYAILKIFFLTNILFQLYLLFKYLYFTDQNATFSSVPTMVAPARDSYGNKKLLDVFTYMLLGVTAKAYYPKQSFFSCYTKDYSKPFLGEAIAPKNLFLFKKCKNIFLFPAYFSGLISLLLFPFLTFCCPPLLSCCKIGHACFLSRV